LDAWPKTIAGAVDCKTAIAEQMLKTNEARDIEKILMEYLRVADCPLNEPQSS
jgi:hypothetical protein